MITSQAHVTLWQVSSPRTPAGSSLPEPSNTKKELKALCTQVFNGGASRQEGSLPWREVTRVKVGRLRGLEAGGVRSALNRMAFVSSSSSVLTKLRNGLEARGKPT